jgi:hypothetical protein
MLQAASKGLAGTDNKIKPGCIVEKVKEELNKTVEAKRKLLEKNFINFRFDEYRRSLQKAKEELEELDRKR